MFNFERMTVAMMAGVALMTLGCGDKESETLEPEPGGVAPVLAWAEVLQQSPDSIGTDAGAFFRWKNTQRLPWLVKDKASGIEMLLVLPGKFVMGMSLGDSEATSSERPSHEVTITKPFYLGRTEVTAEQWVKVMGVNPSKAELRSSERSQLLTKYMREGRTKEEANQLADNHPAIAISWDDCQKFCAKVGLNLPTEAQWEFACRAGLREPRYGHRGFTVDFTLDPIAWSSVNSAGRTHPVAQKAPNALGFYDYMITAPKNISVQSFGVQDSVSFGIKEDGLAHVFGILRNQLYSDKILAVIREYSCNAVDANVENGNEKRPIRVTLPNMLDKTFKVRDFGRGLTDGDIHEIYAFYGESTKRSSNKFIGQLGLGSKAAFAYGDNFVINSFVDGKKTTYNAFIDATQIGKISKLVNRRRR